MLICWCCVQLRITASIGVHDSATPQTCIAIVHFLLICDEVCLKKNAIFPRVQSICLRVFQVSNSSNWAQLSLVLRQQIQFDDVGHRCRPFDSITRGINQGLKASRPQLDINIINYKWYKSVLEVLIMWAMKHLRLSPNRWRSNRNQVAWISSTSSRYCPISTSHLVGWVWCGSSAHS